MTAKTNSPVLFNSEKIYKTFFCDGICGLILIFQRVYFIFLDGIAEDGDKIILINVDQENSLFDDRFTRNVLKKICLDNLSHVYVQKYVKKIDKGYINAMTDLDFLVDENCKYSNFLDDLIVQLEKY